MHFPPGDTLTNMTINSQLPPMAGLIDMHSHVLPGIDDGCRTPLESLHCVRALIEAGFVASICTPHVWPEQFPANTKANIEVWTQSLQREIDRAGLEYQLYTGGEIRLHAKVIEYWQARHVITLAGSRCVLVDFWEPDWPTWVDDAFDWLLEHDYQPILAHPERLGDYEDIDQRLAELKNKGVLLQGNCNPMTGEDGYLPDMRIRQWLAEGRYDLLGLDMHIPETLPSRLDGMMLIREELGDQMVVDLIERAPRRIVFSM